MTQGKNLLTTSRENTIHESPNITNMTQVRNHKKIPF